MKIITLTDVLNKKLICKECKEYLDNSHAHNLNEIIGIQFDSKITIFNVCKDCINKAKELLDEKS